MNRRIITQQFNATGGGVEIDTYKDRLFKYIPADVVAAWTAVTGLIAGATISPGIFWVLFFVFIVLTALWTHRQTSQKGQPPVWIQIVIASIAFIVWVFALGGSSSPFSTFSWYSQVYGSILLIVYTLAVPLIVP